MDVLHHGRDEVEVDPWLRTNGVNTDRVAAKVMFFDSLGKKVRGIYRV